MFMLSFIDPAVVLSMFFVVIHFCDSVWSFWVEANLCKFIIISLNLFYRWRSNYQEGPLNCLIMSQAMAWISSITCRGLFMFMEEG
jgi:hypothetical protein